MKSNHIQESQYFLQIVKCLDENCCRPLRLNYLEITSESFLPLPVVVTRHLVFKAQLGITPLKNFPKGIPYDYNCPVAQDVINKRLRSVCGLYLASIKKMSSHKGCTKTSKESCWSEESKIKHPVLDSVSVVCF